MTSLHKIAFVGSFTSAAFERHLKAFQKETRSRNVREVVVGLKKVTWCDPYALCLLILWIQSLKAKTIDIHVTLPRISLEDITNAENKEAGNETTLARLNFFSFLIQSRFIEILDDLGISHDPIDTSLATHQPKQTHSLISPFLQFSQWPSLKSFLNALRSSDQFSLFFKEASQYSVVRSGKIRDIILRELGDNIFDHAEGDAGLLVMDKNTSHGYGGAPWEELFFRRLKDKEYLEIVISDRGPGIPKTLRKAYNADKSIKKPIKITDSDILEYSFLQYTTKKKPEQRLKKLIDVLKGTNQKDVIPATGLYWVKETCREFNALLCVRSRDSILVFDFLNKPELIRPLRVRNINVGKKSVKLEDFPGVQIKMCFPISESHPPRPSEALNNISDTVKNKPHRLITLASFFRGTDPDNIDTQARPLLDTINGIQKIKLQAIEPQVIVVDLEDVRISTKALFILGVELMRMQDPNNSIVAINAQSLNGLHSQLSEFRSQQITRTLGVPKEKVLPSFDSNWSLRLLGLDTESENTLIDCIQRATKDVNSTPLSKPDILLLESVKHLIQPTALSGKYSWTFSFSDLQKCNTESLITLIQDTLTSTDKKNRIYYPSQWFLIPSESYCYGFFEIGKLLARHESKQKMARWLRSRLAELQPDVLVIMGSNEGLATLLLGHKTPYKQINIDDPEKISSWTKLTLLEKGTKLVIFVGVIGTGTTLRAVIERLPAVEVIKILTIVDARDSVSVSNDKIKIEGKIYNLESILRHPITFESGLPERCTYQDIVVIDPVSHAPIWPVQKEGPLWGDFDSFLDTVIRETNSVAAGHFESSSKHILYFFITPLIIEKFENLITDSIRQDIKLTYQQMQKKPQINTIFFPDKSPGAEIVAAKLCLIPEFLGSFAIPIKSKVLDNPLSYPWSQGYEIKDAIIFDDAASSGTTIEHMIDIAESWGAKRIFVYILFNRCDDFQTRLLEKRKGHGKAKVEVRFLTHVKIPAYEIAKCPVCRSIQELETAKKQMQGNKALAQYIETKIAQLKPQPIGLFSKESTRGTFLSTDIDRRISRCKLRRKLELAITDPGERNALAKLIRGKERNNILLFFQVLAKEKHVFDPNDPNLGDLFYTTFRQDLIKTARKIYSKPSTISPKELDATINVLRMFDEDIFLADLDLLISKTHKSDAHFFVVLTNLLTSNKVERQPDILLDILRNYENILNPDQLALFNDLLISSRSDNDSTPELFITALLALHPSSGPSVSFQFLHYEISAFLRGLSDASHLENTMRVHWVELARRLNEETIPHLTRLLLSFKARKLALAVVKQLEERMAEANSYIKACEELYDEILDEDDKDVRHELIERFDNYILELQDMLCSDEPETIHTALEGMTAEFRYAVRSTVNMVRIQNILKKHRIECEIVVPDEACYVFCHESELVHAIVNLVENLAHAFEGNSTDNRKARIEVEKLAGCARLSIRDAGEAKLPIKPGIGLQKVDSIVSSFGGKFLTLRTINDPLFKSEVGFELITIAEDIIS